MLAHRPIEAEDLEVICRFAQSESDLFFAYPAANFPLTGEQLRNGVSNRFDPTVVLLDGDIAGFADFRVCEYRRMCEIGHVMVAPAARRRGVAGFLIHVMTQIAFSKHQAQEIQLACFNANVAGLLLYTKLQFKPFSIEERRDKRGNLVALIHMRLLKAELEHER